MSSYYNNIPIYETINISYGNIETLDTTTLKTKNLFIDNVKSSEKVITQNLTLDTDNIESLSKASNAPYTSDNNKITSKGYVDEAINNISAPDLSSCVKNNTNQTLTNKFILSNSNNELTANKIIINSNEINDINKVSDDATADNKTLYTKKKIDTDFLLKTDGVGQKYYVSGTLKGEIFNDYTNNQASGNYSHSEGNNTKASGNYSHCEGYNNTASSRSNHCEGENNTLSGTSSHCEGSNNTASGDWSHCEGYGGTLTGNYSHCEGYQCQASGNYSHCEGEGTNATVKWTHAGGYWTYADQLCQTAIGKCNTRNNTNAYFSVGNGTSSLERSDALVVYKNGEVKINSTATDTTPKLTLGTSKSLIGTTATSSSTQSDDAKIATKYYVDNALSGYSPDLSSCVKNNTNQSLTNKFIMSNSNNEITAKYLTIDNKLISKIETVSGISTIENETLMTKLSLMKFIMDLVYPIYSIFIYDVYIELDENGRVPAGARTSTPLDYGQWVLLNPTSQQGDDDIVLGLVSLKDLQYGDNGYFFGDDTIKLKHLPNHAHIGLYSGRYLTAPGGGDWTLPAGDWGNWGGNYNQRVFTTNEIGTASSSAFTTRGTQSPFHPMGYYTFIYKKTGLN